MAGYVAARIKVEILHPDEAGRIEGDGPIPPQWLAADGCRLTITTQNGAPLWAGTLERMTLAAETREGELMRYYYTPTQYPEEQ